MDLFHWELLFALAGGLRGVGGVTTRFLFTAFVRTRASLTSLDDLPSVSLGGTRDLLMNG
jgi:hypothetical protein